MEYYELERIPVKWNKKYELAKAYYEYYGNLEIPNLFKTLNGVKYDENGIALGTWINTQRQAYKGNGKSKITEEQIQLLENLDMKWYSSDKKDDKYQSELINISNKNRKKIEILNRVKSYLIHYNGSFIKEEINRGMIDELNHVLKK